MSLIQDTKVLCQHTFFLVRSIRILRIMSKHEKPTFHVEHILLWWRLVSYFWTKDPDKAEHALWPHYDGVSQYWKDFICNPQKALSDKIAVSELNWSIFDSINRALRSWNVNHGSLLPSMHARRCYRKQNDSCGFISNKESISYNMSRRSTHQDKAHSYLFTTPQSTRKCSILVLSNVLKTRR